MFEVGSKQPKGAGMVDVAVGYDGTEERATKADIATNEEVKSSEEDEESLLVANEGLPRWRTTLKGGKARIFHGLPGFVGGSAGAGPKDGDPISLIEAEFGPQRRKPRTKQCSQKPRPPKKSVKEDNFMSALDEANDVLRTLEELTQDDDFEGRTEESEEEDSTANPAMLVVDVPKVPGAREAAKAWEVDMGGAETAKRRNPASLGAWKRKGQKYHRGSPVHGKKERSKIDKKKKYKSGAQIAQKRKEAASRSRQARACKRG